MKLKVAPHSSDPKFLVKAMRSELGAKDLNTRNCALEGSGLFEFTKRKLNLPPGTKYDFRSPHKVNYSTPRPNTRSTKARIEESFKHDESVVSHTTNMLEVDCPQYQCHSYSLPYPLKNECQALHANTWHQCNAKVEKIKHGMLSPTYRGSEKEFRSNNHIPTNFWFSTNDINQFVKGSKRKWVFKWPNLSKVWLVRLV